MWWDPLPPTEKLWEVMGRGGVGIGDVASHLGRKLVKAELS